MLFRGLGPGNPWKRSPGTIRTHTDLYGSIRIHTDPSQVNFQYFVGHMLSIFGKVCQRNIKVHKKTFFNEHHSCSPYNSVQDAQSIKFWGPSFDDFVDINILMIWGVLGVAY